MTLTQMLAVLNGEVPYWKYNRLSHFNPNLEIERGRFPGVKETDNTARPILDDDYE